MDLEINDKTSLKDIQEAFNRIYPYLWIDFFYKAVNGSDHTRPEKIKPETAIKNISALNGNGLINIDGKKSVAELENEFCKTLGLKVKVMRKSGNVWVGTPYTTNWTLNNQNSEGEQIIMDL